MVEPAESVGASIVEISQAMPRRSRRRRLAAVLAVLVALGVGGYFALRNSAGPAGFPPLAPGVYVGTLAFAEVEHRLPLIVQYDPEKGSIFSAVLDPDWQPTIQQRPLADNPLTLSGEDQEWLLSGVALNADRLQGEVTQATGDLSGRWTLVRTEILSSAGLTTEEERHWLLLAQERGQTSAKLSAAETRTEEQKKELSELQALLSDRTALRTSVEEQLRTLTRERDELLTTVKLEEEKRRSAADQISLLTRVSPAGRLAALGRDTLEREARWYESMLRSAPAGTNGAIQVAGAEAEELLALRNQIDDEQAKINKLREMYPGVN